MTDQLAEDLARGNRAKQLLSDDLLTEAFTKLEAAYVEAWKSWPAADTKGREWLWTAVNVLGKVRSHLQSVANSGTLAKAELEGIGQSGGSGA